MLPDFYPIWASEDVNLPVSGNPNKSRPVEALRDVGYDLGQKPSAEEFNWMWNCINDWIVYFNEETILARDIGNNLTDILEVVDVRNNAQTWSISTGTSTVTENASSTNISLSYSLGEVVEVITSMEPKVGSRDYVFEVSGVSIPATDGVDFFIEVDGVKSGVRVAGSGAVRLTNPATVIDAAYTFGNTSEVGLRLNADGSISVYLDGDIQLTGDLVSRTAESVVKFGYVIDGSGANTFEVNVSHNYSHTFLMPTTGAHDSSNNPFDSSVAGIDTLDSRKLSKATEIHPGVARIATQEEINQGVGEGFVTSEKFYNEFKDNQSTASNSYIQRFPGGMIMMGGRNQTPSTGNFVTITFPEDVGVVPISLVVTAETVITSKNIARDTNTDSVTSTDFVVRFGDNMRDEFINWQAVWVV